MKKYSIPVLCFTFFTVLTHAQSFTDRKDVRLFINKTAKKHHLDKTALKKELDKVKLRKKIIQSIKRPAERKPWREYHKLFVTPKRIKQGVDFWQANQTALTKAQKKYGVSVPMIVAILGVETNYGEHQGKYRVLDSLATLAFEYPRRAKFFKRELAQFFLLCHEQNISPQSVLGSYAGAIGQPQFMPSSYRYYAVDFSGNGKKDLRQDTEDAIGSVANYFKVHGWKNNQSIADKAIISGRRYKKLKVNARRARYSLKKLNKYGVKTSNKRPPRKAGLVALHNNKSSEFWVAYPNFFVITRYNTSKQYAMAVHLLAKNIKEEWTKQKKTPKHIA
jgi:membrane-bound lytic murein transglycosylase B